MSEQNGVGIQQGFVKHAESTDTPTIEQARDVVEDVKEHGTVLSLSRIGAHPMLRHTPYRNHRGTVVDMWSCISYYFEPMPHRTLLNYPHIVMPWKLDDWEVNLITTPWVVQQVAHTAWGRLEILKPEETPFGDGILQWDVSREGENAN